MEVMVTQPTTATQPTTKTITVTVSETLWDHIKSALVLRRLSIQDGTVLALCMFTGVDRDAVESMTAHESEV